MPLRVGIVGAGCRRQGIGQHVARHLADLGADVVAIAGSRADTADQTASFLAHRYGLHVRPYGSLPAMLAREPLDAVAICSPDPFHRQHLLEALAAGVHVLCEKPLVFEDGRDPVADARTIVEGFTAAGRVLMVNEQWPFTLTAFQRLYPDVRRCERPPREFAMRLSPDAFGPDMIPNSLPHALSLLLALMPVPDGEGCDRRADQIDVEFAEVDGMPGAAARVQFVCHHAQGHTRVDVMMRRTAEAPRPAGYAIDGRWAWRQIEMPEYRMWLQRAGSDDGYQSSDNRHQIPDDRHQISDDRYQLSAVDRGCRAVGDGGSVCYLKSEVRPFRAPLDDPLRLLLADFLKHCAQADRAASAYRDTTILTRLAMLRDVSRVACRQLEGAR
jgi:hypothetical protein